MNGFVSRKFAATTRSLRTALFSRTVKMRNRRAIISFTFDDFPRTAVSNGARLLEDHGVRGTFYATGSYCERTVEDVPQYHAEDIISLARAGHEIGCHTFTHPRVSSLRAAELKEEIELNSAFLSRLLPNNKMQTFAYPFGDLSLTATIRLQAMFAGCRSSEHGLNIDSADLGRLRSIRLYDRLMTPKDISQLIKQAVAKNAWLIFYTHDVSRKPSSFGCAPSLFEYALASTISAGAEVRPVHDAIKAVGGFD
jgi:peptidoglycan/xylan/chitin deacetylase (PgdA/CDA1 family)